MHELCRRMSSAPVALLLTLMMTLALAACGRQDGAGGTPTRVPATPADAPAIRRTDFSRVAAFQTLMRQVGGEFEPGAVTYADLTGDGRDEAIVPISSGGTLGNLAYQVYTLRSGKPVVILTSTRDQTSAGGQMMAVEDGTLVRTTARYGPEDPFCCPSALVKTYYRWDGEALQVEREEEVKAPPSPKFN